MAEDSTPFKISCSLVGHEQDVRAVAVAFQPEGAIISGSRDKTARLWIPNTPDPSYTEGSMFSGHANFISSVCAMPPDDKYPHGLIVTGSNDNTILGFTLDSLEPAFKLEGHSDTVCTLAAGKFGSLLSGSWDKTAKVWLNQKCVMTLSGHEAAVWAVAIMPEGGYMLTGSADKMIKLWRAGKCQQTFKGHTDCVRGVAILSATEFLSCSNDATIRKWQTTGECTHTFYGHTNFVYSLAILPDGKNFVSSGEDRTLRVWKDGQCVQTITHPAQSVWSISTLPNGDVVTGSSDGVVRVFTRAADRQAPPDLQKQFEEQLAASSIPSQIGDIKTEDLVGPEALLNPGKADGQTLMVREENAVTAHQWMAAEGRWQKIGDVVGGSGGTQASSGKQLYNGKEYDFVFDVDIQEDKPPLKLPYNINEDPWMVAHNWLADNDISQMYLDQVAKFIMEQTKGITIGAPAAPSGGPGADPFTGGGRYIPGTDTRSGGGMGGVDPFTGGSRYNPGGSAAPPPSQPAVSSGSMGDSMFPHNSYLSFDQANVKAMIGKLTELNEQAEIKVSSEDLDKLGQVLTDGSDTSNVLPTVKTLMQWPQASLVPVLDVLRLVVKDESGNKFLCDGKEGDEFIQYILICAEPERPAPNRMLAVRTICNAFRHSWGENLLIKNRDEVMVTLLNFRDSTTNKNHQIAVSTALLNFSVAFRMSREPEDRIACISAASMLGPNFQDPEARYRLLICIGTLMSVCDKIKQVAISLDVKPFVVSCSEMKAPQKVPQCAQQVLVMLP